MIIAIILIVLIVIIIVAVKVGLIIRKNNAKNKILTSLEQLGQVGVGNKTCYDYRLTMNNKEYLIKVIYNFSNFEISVNNKNYWEINDKVVSSKKSGTKLEGIYDLINTNEFAFELPVKKVYLIYPSAKVLLKAVNESELTFIYPNTNCYGVNLIKFDEINNAIKEI